jgi:putative 2OG-Fe(II) oxygenase
MCPVKNSDTVQQDFQADSPDWRNTDSVAQIHSIFLKNGHVSLPSLLPQRELKIIQTCAQQMLASPAVVYSKQKFDEKSKNFSPLLFREEHKNTIYYDPLGVNEDFDRVINGLFNLTGLVDLLQRVLGAEFRLWHMLIRRSEPGAKNLVLHQDLPGEVGLAIFLDDVPDGLGSTCFVRGSHRWPRLFQTNTHIDPKWMKIGLQHAQGKAGDGYLFYNQTWHGVANSKEHVRTAIVFTFIPAKSNLSLRIPSEDLISRVGENLRPLLRGQQLPLKTQNRFLGPDEIVDGTNKVALFSCSRLIHVINLVYRLMFGIYGFVKRS